MSEHFVDNTIQKNNKGEIMKPTNQPQVKLKGIEYLLLAIQSAPGKSQRHYLRRLYQYQHGVPSYNNGGTNNGYFTSESYRGVLWYDAGYAKWCSAMRLTSRGHKRANEVRKKLGLEPIDLLTWVPDRAI